MNDAMRYAAEKEPIHSGTAVRSDDDQIMPGSRRAHSADRIACADQGGDGELRAGQRLGGLSHDVFGLAFVLLGPGLIAGHDFRLDHGE